ncbi:hypothetical protein [Ammoniphilus sp. 3BR4]|uniref:hypothetical protein n=1 Tax=Ammoniphilus sp. 3BR4 TaxID=3158265 RepID=UPI003466DDF0
MTKVVLWGSLIVPWLSLFFLKRDIIKRYMPVAIFVSLLVTIIFEMAHVFNWWVMKEAIVPWGYITNVAFTYGAFLVGTIWIFYFTFRKWWLYLITNIVIDGAFAFFLNDIFNGWIYQLVRFNEWGVFLLMVSLAVVIYGYQLWQEGVLIKPNEKERELETNFKIWFRRKEKAK